MKLLSVFWIAVILSVTFSAAGAKDMDGFRGIPWGSDIESILRSDPKLVEGHMGVMPGVKAFQRTDEDLDYGGIKADTITYAFYKGRFTSVSIDFRGIDNFEKLLNYCKKEFGPVTGSVVSRLEHYAGFDSPKTGVMLLYQLSMQTTNYGRLYLYSKELVQ